MKYDPIPRELRFLPHVEDALVERLDNHGYNFEGLFHRDEGHGDGGRRVIPARTDDYDDQSAFLE